MTVCNTPANVTGCFALVNRNPDTWVNCEKCVCMQKLNTGCPEPLSLAICQVKRGLNSEISAKCFSKIPSALIILMPTIVLIVCFLGCLMYKKRGRRDYSGELQTSLKDSSNL